MGEAVLEAVVEAEAAEEPAVVAAAGALSDGPVDRDAGRPSPVRVAAALARLPWWRVRGCVHGPAVNTPPAAGPRTSRSSQYGPTPIIQPWIVQL